MVTTGPVSKMASQQKKAFCVLRFEVSRSVITVQREFRAQFRTAGSIQINNKPDSLIRRKGLDVFRKDRQHYSDSML
jgi:hypothetical protein